MFISIKWKAVVFLTLLLVLVTALWIGQNVLQTLDRYAEERQNSQQQHQRVFEEMLEDNALKLSHFAQMLADDNTMMSSSTPAQRLNQHLDERWFSLNLNLGIDYVAVLNHQGRLVANSFSETSIHSPDWVEAIVNEKILNQSASPMESNFLYCEYSCLQFVVEPVISSKGDERFIVLGQNISELIVRYNAMTGSDLAVLIEYNPTHLTEGAVRREGFLPNWQMSVWAASRYSQTVRLLQDQAAKLSWDSLITDSLVEWEEAFYLFNPFDLSINTPQYFDAEVLGIVNETQRQQQLNATIINGVATALGVLLVSEIVLVLLLLAPIQRLIVLAKALNLLPEHRYTEINKALRHRQTVFQDELSLLETNARQAVAELETLHREVRQTNASLNDQLNALSRSRAFLSRLLDHSNLYVITQNYDFEILSKNRKYEQERGLGANSFLSIFSDHLSRKEFKAGILRLQSDQQLEAVFNQETRLKTATTEEALYVSWTHSLVEDENGQPLILSIGMDFTQRKRDESALKWLANNDALTQIGNRRAFNASMRYMLESFHSGAVVFIDLNHFKQINDLFGHAVGDQVLVEVASILKQEVRSNDAVCRLAGDEFTVVLQEIRQSHLERLLEKLSQALNSHLTLENDQVLEYSVSIGAAMFPQHGRDIQTLTVHADMAMYQAKKKGMGYWHVFNPNDNNLDLVEKDHATAVLIRSALQSGAGLFSLVFQPIMSIQTGEMSHYEVLLRLTDQEGQAVFPDEFIPTAEKMGLIRQIDEWVLDHAFARLEQESRFNPELHFAINISAPTLQSMDMVSMLSHYFERYDIHAHQVVIELTETAYIDNFNQVLNNLETLNNAGFSIALDDFGVGFSSFSYLKKMPLKYVKLDGAYIRDLTHNSDNQVFVESLTKMVEAFGMQTIAEFVEDQATLDKLSDLGVSYAQGWHIGKPEPELLIE